MIQTDELTRASRSGEDKRLNRHLPSVCARVVLLDTATQGKGDHSMRFCASRIVIVALQLRSSSAEHERPAKRHFATCANQQRSIVTKRWMDTLGSLLRRLHMVLFCLRILPSSWFTHSSGKEQRRCIRLFLSNLLFGHSRRLRQWPQGQPTRLPSTIRPSPIQCSL